MKLSCAAIVTFAAMLLFVTLARTSERSTDVLMKLEADLMAAISEGGYDAAMPYFAEDGALLPRGGGIVTGKAKNREAEMAAVVRPPSMFSGCRSAKSGWRRMAPNAKRLEARSSTIPPSIRATVSRTALGTSSTRFWCNK